MSNTGTALAESRKHYEILDGMRGIAALAVVIFHFAEWVHSDFSGNFIAHGFLAVDFFFCLSGFVIAYAYDTRIARIGIWNFFKTRLIRLHPLVVLGSVLGLLAFIFDPYVTDKVIDFGKTALLFFCSILMIPMPVMEERAFNNFGLNAPSWSLFWEYVANIFYAIFLYRLQKKALLVLTAFAAVWLWIVSYKTGNIVGGWSGENFLDGGARVSFSFLAGMLIYRYNLIIKNNFGFPGLSFLLILAFIMPWTSYNWITQPLVVMLYFPLLVSLGAGAAISPKTQKFCKFSGDISYPLYMTHYAGIWVFGNYLTTQNPQNFQINTVIIVGTILMIAFAYLIMKVYDIPVRNYLTKRLKQQR